MDPTELESTAILAPVRRHASRLSCHSHESHIIFNPRILPERQDGASADRGLSACCPCQNRLRESRVDCAASPNQCLRDLCNRAASHHSIDTRLHLIVPARTCHLHLRNHQLWSPQQCERHADGWPIPALHVVSYHWSRECQGRLALEPKRPAGISSAVAVRSTTTR